MSNIQIDPYKTYSQEIEKGMTTIIAIKCKEGIVIASDSQSTSRVAKNMQVSKTYEINKSIGIGASGDERAIKVLVETLKQMIIPGDLKSEQVLKESIKKIVIDLHREYNSERSLKLGFDKIQFVFTPEALIGAILSDGSFSLFHIMSDSWVDPVDDYKSIGSGFPLANLVLTQQSRYLNIGNKKFSELSLLNNSWIATIVINEVKAVEPYTGGNTNIVIIDEKGYDEIQDKKQQELYETLVNITTAEFKSDLMN
jgi:proteasome alpha subunit